MLTLSLLCNSWQPLGQGLPIGSPVGRSAPPCATTDACGPLHRVVHRVSDQDLIAQFYESCIGLQVLTPPGKGAGKTLLGKNHEALCLELVPGAAGSGYAQLSVRVPSVDKAVERVRKWYADAGDDTAVAEPKTVEHGASLIPEQPEETVTPVRQAFVEDPSSASLLLWEAEGDEGPATLSGALLDVYEWKKSQTWYEENLGWSTLRFQSNVPYEASMTVTLGAPSLEVPGPCGGAEEAVLQLRYTYGTPKIQPPDGLVALAVRRPSGENKLVDPDGYPLLLSVSA